MVEDDIESNSETSTPAYTPTSSRPSSPAAAEEVDEPKIEDKTQHIAPAPTAEDIMLECKKCNCAWICFYRSPDWAKAASPRKTRNYTTPVGKCDGCGTDWHCMLCEDAVEAAEWKALVVCFPSYAEGSRRLGFVLETES